MTRQKSKFIALGGLLHDIGKMLERGKSLNWIKKDAYYTGFCPDKQGYASHQHSAFTRWFCDHLEAKFDCLRNLDDSVKGWKDWSASHHKNEEGVEFKIIQMADRLSSSEREEGDFYIHGVNKRTLLEPVIERVFLWDNNKSSTMHRYPLKPLDSDRDSCFPKPAEELGLEKMEDPDSCSDKGKWRHLLSKDELEEEYENLCQGFLDEVNALSEVTPEISLDDLFITLIKLVEKYTANVPSATNLRHPDISLYDHLRTTAAIAECMYLYCQDVKNDFSDDRQWVLACGDFSGIQKFIYNLTNKGAAKGLKGRSFYVQFFCRICSDYILRELGLSRTSCLYNSGGKFYLLLPSNYKKKLESIRDQINDQLLQKFDGDVFLGLGTCEITKNMFQQGEMHSAWKTTAEYLAKDRQHKFKSQIDHDFFEPDFNSDHSKSCNVCGSRKNLDNKDYKCSECQKLENIGRYLGDTDAFVCLWDNDSKKILEEKLRIKSDRFVPFGFGATVAFVPKDSIANLSTIKKLDAECIFLGEYCDLSFTDSDLKYKLPCCAISSLYLAKWAKTDWEFDDFANASKGVKRLGVLRMDVDNLGLVFIRGLKFLKNKNGWGEPVKGKDDKPERTPMASISRMASLSRQLNHFFSAYFPRLLKDDGFSRSQIIYAGGDDLFVIGSWDELPALAKKIRDEFDAFCCGNKDFGISGGITIQKGKYPIYKGAHIAGEAEEKAKSLMKEWAVIKTHKKNCLTFLDIPIPWKYFEGVMEIKNHLMQDQERENNKGLLSYLSKVVEANSITAEIKAKKFGPRKAWDEISYYPWRWRLAYFLKRRYGSPKNSEETEKWIRIILGNKVNGMDVDDNFFIPVFMWMGIPVKWVHNLNRD